MIYTISIKEILISNKSSKLKPRLTNYFQNCWDTFSSIIQRQKLGISEKLQLIQGLLKRILRETHWLHAPPEFPELFQYLVFVYISNSNINIWNRAANQPLRWLWSPGLETVKLTFQRNYSLSSNTIKTDPTFYNWVPFSSDTE